MNERGSEKYIKKRVIYTEQLGGGQSRREGGKEEDGCLY